MIRTKVNAVGTNAIKTRKVLVMIWVGLGSSASFPMQSHAKDTPPEGNATRVRGERRPRPPVDAPPGDETDRPHRFGPGGEGRRFRPAMSEEEKAELLDFIRERFPLIGEELDEVQVKYPKRLDRRLARLAPEMRRLMELSETDPERADLIIQERKLDMRVRLTARRYQAAKDDATRERVRNELRQQVEEQFNVRVKRRESDIVSLEARIDELKAKLSDTIARRDQLIAEQLKNQLSRTSAGETDTDTDEEPAPQKK